MMISLSDVYKVVTAMVPLYVALCLGYGSVRWWKIFTPAQCEAVNRLVAFFTLPFFTFQFACHADPLSWNYRFIAADAISKVIIVAVLSVWAKCGGKNSYCWSITSYSLATLTSSLVVGVPLLQAMYGTWAQDLVVQVSVVQAIVWLTLLLFVLELRNAKSGVAVAENIGMNGAVVHVVSVDESPPAKDQTATTENGSTVSASADEVVGARPVSFWALMKVVWLKLALNPNTYASIIGVTYAFIASRWHFEMPSIMEGSILIMSKAGTGMAMFSMGLFMALQEKIIACGTSLTVFGMILKFIAGPATAAIGAIAVGLRGDILRVAIIQAALPQSITSFIFAREYGLHADVLSTAVIFGTLVSLPVLIGYYVVLGMMS